MAAPRIELVLYMSAISSRSAAARRHCEALLPRAYVIGDLSNSAALVDLLSSSGVDPRR